VTLIDRSECERAKFDLEEFFAQFWRTKPLYVPGHASEFLGTTWTAADFDAARDAARARGAVVNEVPGEVTFIENVSRVDDDLARRAKRLAAVFGAPRAWFDSIRTYSRSGIGPHFDHSDNFVLQQDGIKEWSLASPSNIDQSLIARRMLNEPGVGSHKLPEDRLQFQLGPGDLLYIPLMWLHEGLSHAESSSLSFVCPGMSLYSAVVSCLTKVLRERGLGSEPLPALHSGLTYEQHQSAVKSIGETTTTLLRHIADSEIIEAVLECQNQVLFRASDPNGR
jgi:50S ribosomal protein L16 3-hydroxylase